MKLVIIESPFQGGLPRNVQYLERCMADSLKRGEAPFASHRLYPGILDDLILEQRELGMKAGWAWMEKASLVAVYEDYGVTPGMAAGILNAERWGLLIEHRMIGPDRAPASALLHQLWSQARDQPGYDKEKWKALQKLIEG